MSDPTDPAAWVERAEEDFLMVRSALRRRKPLTYSACFHAQQCAEKYLKAILVMREVKFPKTHDLLLLSGLCEQAGVLVAIDPERLNTLSTHAVLARYPGDDPSVEDAREARKIAGAVRRFSRAWLGPAAAA
jgi:HEPN domain-containing protein